MSRAIASKRSNHTSLTRACIACHTEEPAKIHNNRCTDPYVLTVIAKGDLEVGKSAVMPIWGGVLNEDKIKDVVAYLRTLSRPAQTGRRS